MPMNYYADTAGSEDDENIRAHLYALNTVALQYGFESLFDIALAQPRLFPKEAREFAESEGLGKLYGYCCTIGRKPITAIVHNDLCRMSQNVYLSEWQTLLNNKSFKIKLETFNQDHIQAFSFENIYNQMAHDIPNLIALVNLLISSHPSKRKIR